MRRRERDRCDFCGCFASWGHVCDHLRTPLGDSIDRLFMVECQRLGLDHHIAIAAPIEFLAMALLTKNASTCTNSEP